MGGESPQSSGKASEGDYHLGDDEEDAEGGDFIVTRNPLVFDSQDEDLIRDQPLSQLSSAPPPPRPFSVQKQSVSMAGTGLGSVRADGPRREEVFNPLVVEGRVGLGAGGILRGATPGLALSEQSINSGE